MTPAVLGMVAATYVRDIEASRSFYQLLGFRERSSGNAAASAWSALQHGEYQVLLASTWPPLDVPPLPLLFCLCFDDLDAVIGALREGGFDVLGTGSPWPLPGGEAQVRDPDGNAVLLGGRERPATRPPAGNEDACAPFSLLAEAAAMAAGGGGWATCQVRDVDGKRCSQPGVLKLADSAGDSVWACLDHADEILVTVRGAFLASQAGDGVASYRSSRRG